MLVWLQGPTKPACGRTRNPRTGSRRWHAPTRAAGSVSSSDFKAPISAPRPGKTSPGPTRTPSPFAAAARCTGACRLGGRRAAARRADPHQCPTRPAQPQAAQLDPIREPRRVPDEPGVGAGAWPHARSVKLGGAVAAVVAGLSARYLRRGASNEGLPGETCFFGETGHPTPRAWALGPARSSRSDSARWPPEYHPWELRLNLRWACVSRLQRLGRHVRHPFTGDRDS